jgi:hypothetical protein
VELAIVNHWTKENRKWFRINQWLSFDFGERWFTFNLLGFTLVGVKKCKN